MVSVNSHSLSTLGDAGFVWAPHGPV